MKKSSRHILESKLFPPKLPSDYVKRTDLKTLLDKHVEVPLILISAPAGYGKSTLVADWLNNQAYTSAWISLNKSENSFLRFIHYLTAAVGQVYPQIESELVEIINLGDSSSNEIITTVINVLGRLNKPITIVLDDYHLISNQEIHELITVHTTHPTSTIRFVLISRTRSNISTNDFKDNDRIFELETKDLSFTANQIIQYYNTSIDQNLSIKDAKLLKAQTEGWITGIKMVTISNSAVSENSKSSINYLINKLFIKFLAGFDEEEKILIFVSSEIVEFSVELLVYCMPNIPTDKIDRTLDLLKTSNIFIVNLDKGNNWYRFHHFFNDLVHTELLNSIPVNDVVQICERTGEWYEQHNNIEKAIEFFVKGENYEKGFNLYRQERVDLLNNKNWSQLNLYEQLFAKTDYSSAVESVLSTCWLDIYSGSLMRMFEKLPELETRLHKMEVNQATDRLRGEFYALLLYRLYNIDHNYERILQICSSKGHLIPEDHYQAISLYWIFYSASLQMAGQYKEAIKVIYFELDKVLNPEIRRSLLLVECYLHYFEGNLDLLDKSSKNFLKSGVEQKSNQTTAEGYLFRGMFYYLEGKLDEAHEHLKFALQKKEYIIGPHRLFASTALCTVELFLNGYEKYDKLSQNLEESFKFSSGKLYRNYWLATQLELKAILKETPESYSSELPADFPLIPISNHADPNLSEIKWLLATNYDDSSLILSKIDRLEEFIQRLSNRKVLLSLKVARAIYLYHYVRPQIGITMFAEVWQEIRKKNLIMLIAEFGYVVIPLINNLLTSSIAGDEKLFQILNIIIPNPKIKLTRREFEILQLIKEPNGEIAKRLYIAEKTVKRHKNNLYKKLNVKNVKEAIEAASHLNLKD